MLSCGRNKQGPRNDNGTAANEVITQRGYIIFKIEWNLWFMLNWVEKFSTEGAVTVFVPTDSFIINTFTFIEALTNPLRRGTYGCGIIEITHSAQL